MAHRSSNYREILSNYYGKPKPPKMTAMKSVVLAQQFDDGTPVVLSWPVSAYEEPLEYAGEMSREYDYAEEMVVADDFPTEMGGDYYVESFEETMPVKEPNQLEKPCGCKDKSQKHYEQQPKPLTVAIPEEAPIPEKTAISKSLTDDDLMADIQSILSGQKQYDDKQKQMVSTNGALPARPEAQEDITPLDQKSNHQIFEQLAQSMRYANAYDLGSISMQNRFEEFDRQDDVSGKKPTFESPYSVDYNVGEVSKAAVAYPPSPNPLPPAIPPDVLKRALAINGYVAPAITELAAWQGKKESQASQREVLKKYWSAVPGTDAADAAEQSATERGDYKEWSAAFICWLMSKAGYGKNEGFNAGPRHLNYIVGALRNRVDDAENQNKLFWLYDINEADAKLEVGDILCSNQKDKSSWTYESLRQTFAGNTTADITGHSHCDVIVEELLQNGKKYLKTIGGNVNDNVDSKLIELDANGKPVNRSLVFGVIKFRT